MTSLTSILGRLRPGSSRNRAEQALARAASLEQQLARALEKIEALSARRAAERARASHIQELLQAKLESTRASLANYRDLRDRMKSNFRELSAERDRLDRANRQLNQQIERERAAHQSLVRQLGRARQRSSWAEPLKQPPGGAVSHAKGYFRLGEHFQMQGAIPMASDAYRRIEPARLRQLLMQKDPYKQFISGPDFLIIGAPRAGTTWLRKLLAYHPELFVLDQEQHYFSMMPYKPPREYVQQFASTHARYMTSRRKLFDKVRAAPRRFYGEKSPTYLAMPECNVELCAALYPDVRIICIVRDPVARAWSHIKNSGLADRAHDLDELRAVRAWNTLEEVVLIGRYEQHLRCWARYFDPSQIRLVDFDRIASDPAGVCRDVVAHIGASPNEDEQAPLGVTVGASGSGGPPAALLEYLQGVYAEERFDIPYLEQAMAAEALGRWERGADAGPDQPAASAVSTGNA